MKDKFYLFAERATLWLIRKHLERAGANVSTADSSDSILLANFGVEPFALEVKDQNLYMEKAVLYTSEMSNLYTFSSICHISSNYGIASTGLTLKEGFAKFYLTKKIPLIVVSDRKAFENELFEFNECMNNVIGYLKYRVDKVSSRVLDISMFEGLNLFGLDLQKLAEYKDFRFGSWENMLDSYMTDEFDFKVDKVPLDTLILACSDFEEKNNLVISEVGEEVLEEILVHRSISILEAEKEYSLH